ncbi:M23/M56 family metallopeptidase [Brevibacillus sp. DP1.3A]|uniref:M23/M56 family metallopeptidase n=1 Tax=Brevibacillus sp. DP1.3A TaxID=2738867 RepID=UPI00156AB4BA|nr:M23/M56 family metallopeptidase [Brevibacillus sp. DP1.3A]UED74827.1 peptidoglycan DD-metalloendopeptidase family protein [Brevibacillus sp. DP1.3A]
MDWQWLTLTLNQAFTWTLYNSIEASLLVILILLCQQLGKKLFPIRWHHAVWFLLLWKLAVPWSIDSTISLYNWLPTSSWTSMQEAHPPTEPIVLATEVLHPHEFALQPDASLTNEASFSWISLLSLIWISGVAIFAITMTLSTYRLLSQLKNDEFVQDEAILRVFSQCQKQMGITKSIPLRMSHQMTSPALMGIWQPQIWLPENLLDKLNEHELRHIFLHELAHWKRRDIPVNSIMSVLLILNWFNPLLWYAASRMRQDQEMACDALVLTYLQETEVPRYGYTMIKILELYACPKQIRFTAGFSSSKKQVKRRIEMIRHFQKRAYTWTLSGIVVVLALGIFTLTDEKKVLGNEQSFVIPAEGTIKSPIDQTIGLRILNDLNTPVQAAAAGKVLKAEYDTKTGKGNQIILEHEDGYQTVYSHLEKLEVTAGTTVTQGQLIGLLGSTGRSTGPHLAFQVLENGIPVDPMKLLVEIEAKE